MDEAYIKRKIENCRMLVNTAISEAQKKIYQGYLEFWKDKSGSTTIDKKIDIVEKDEVKPILEPEPVEAIEEEPEVIEQPKIESKIAEITKLKEQLEARKADAFEIINPNKHAYLRRNGEILKTKAFKEFLNQNEVE